MPPTKTTPKPLRLALLLYPGCMPAGLFAVADMVRAANLRAPRLVCELVWAGVDTAPVATWQGPTLVPSISLDRAQADAVLVPGLWLATASDLDAPLQQLEPVTRALRNLPSSTRIWSYCAGVLPLAASGRLQGVPATATWWLREALQARFKQVQWRFDESVVDGGKVLTAAGAHGHVPLMSHALAERLRPEEWRDVQQLLMLPRPHRMHPTLGGPELMSLTDEMLRRALLIVQRSPAAELRLPQLAEQLHVSSRTLARRVAAQTGMAAAQWMRRIKLRQVADALCESRQPLKRIAEELGFASEAGLIRAFRQATGMTPIAYRMAHA
ncbi:helix-turn-helix domain-containing protein (plasmid) [Diaphorobacter sp. HDW4B]|uniref:GlxA family transcriptional regulator n=1 Tax=Diaphorobacter sp. HDW4B TaxID=2714925 RepID=UPI00140C5FCE|nr:helix-turn-helix domain-containing protein [Diaphorobacter sp. HDW4B]QIL73857.1 helix-turn-helix domain-containing protein [Diaphorobacter sp. HDW4B]